MRSAHAVARSLLAAMSSLSQAQTQTQAQARVDARAMQEHVQMVAKIAAGLVAFAGGEENAIALVESLREGVVVELRYPAASLDGAGVSLAMEPPTGPMDWHDVRMSLMLARDALTAFGVLRPSGEQLRASLLGGEVTVPGARVVAFRGVLRMRAEGQGWGRIASERFQRRAVSRVE